MRLIKLSSVLCAVGLMACDPDRGGGPPGGYGTGGGFVAMGGGYGSSGGGTAVGGGTGGGGSATGGGVPGAGGGSSSTGGGSSSTGGGSSATGGGASGTGGGTSGTGGGTSGTGGGSVTMYTLAVSLGGAGNGSVSGPGISCGTSCFAMLPSGTSAVLTAAPGSGSTLGGWMGCDSSTGMSCTVRLNANRTITATFTTAPPPSVTFTGGTLQQLRAYSSNLVFTDLTVTGPLTIEPSDGASVTLSTSTFTLSGAGTIDFTQGSCDYSPPPNFTLIGTTRIALNAGGISMAGKTGSGTTSSSTCNQCDGVRAGNITLRAPAIALSGGAYLHAWGGTGSYSYVTSAVRVGCAGGAGGTITLDATTTLTVGNKSGFDFSGGNGGYGSNGQRGTNGRLGRVQFTGAAIAEIRERVYPDDRELNAVVQNAQLYTYQRFDLRGNIGPTDDSAQDGTTGSRWVTFTGTGARDFCEDLYVLDLPAAGTIRLALTSTSAGDKDLHLFQGTTTTLLASSNGATSTETITYSAAAAGQYTVCVSWAQDNPPAQIMPYAYRLAVGP